jgi:hypothetical protein
MLLPVCFAASCAPLFIKLKNNACWFICTNAYVGAGSFAKVVPVNNATAVNEQATDEMNRLPVSNNMV